MDVLTMEIEHVDVDSLDYVVLHQGVDVQPRPSTLRIIQVLDPTRPGKKKSHLVSWVEGLSMLV